MTNNILAELFASDPVLIDGHRIGFINACFQMLGESEDFQKLHGNANLQGDTFWDSPWGDGGAHPYRPYSVSNGTLIIPVQGVLMNKFPYQLGRWATGYEYIEKALERGMADSNVQRIALQIDSPGGTVAGCFECADKIYGARGDKPIRAFAADHAYSAAYAIASSAGDVSVTRSGGTGSVGVVTTHVDLSEAYAQMGIKVTFIFAGKHKVDGNAYEPLKDDVKDRIQDRIDRIYGVFTSSVARNRGLEESAVRATEALTFDAQDSVAKGFADRIGALDEEMVAFSEETDPDPEDDEMADKETGATITQAQVDAARTEGQTAGAQAERERMNAILDSAEGKARPKAAMSMVKRGIDAQTAIGLLGDLPEEKAEAPAPQEPQGQGGTTPFDSHMQGTGLPNVGADADAAGGDDKDPDASWLASVKGDVMAYRGNAPKNRQ